MKASTANLLLDALAVTASGVMGTLIRLQVENLARRGFHLATVSVAALACVSCGIVLLYMRRYLTVPDAQVLMCTTFVICYICFRYGPVDKPVPLSMGRFFGGIFFTLLFLMLGALLESSLSP